MISIDNNLFYLINSLAEITFLQWFWKLFVNEYFVPVTLALILFYLWLKRDFKYKKLAVVAMLSVGLTNLSIKITNLIFFRTRPFENLDVYLLYYRPTDSSFPANAAAVAFAIATSIWFVDKNLGKVALALAFIYSLSRVVVGVHYPSDVLFGVVIGVGFAVLVSKLTKLTEFLTRLLLSVLKFLKLEPLF